jgi:hypothetical protein
LRSLKAFSFSGCALVSVGKTPAPAGYGNNYMKRYTALALVAAFALASSLTTSTLRAASYADSVLNYTTGTGFAAGYTNSATALGSPGLTNDFGDNLPFNPAFSTNDLVSIGVGGSLTLGFSTTVQNRPANPFGIDLVIFGNDGFVDNDFPNGLTTAAGDLFSNAFGTPGTSKVFVSADNISYYELLPPLWASARVDTLFPTDAAGTFGLPVNPALAQASFGSTSLAGIRSLYAGSGGGTGFDLAWAVDTNGDPVALAEISYVRIDVLASKVEIDAVVAAVPEPSTWVLGFAGVAGLLACRRRKR